MHPKKSEEHQSYNKTMLAGVKQCNPNVFGDLNQMLPIHLRCSASGTNGVTTSRRSAHCVHSYLRHIGLPANRHGKNWDRFSFTLAERKQAGWKLCGACELDIKRDTVTLFKTSLQFFTWQLWYQAWVVIYELLTVAFARCLWEYTQSCVDSVDISRKRWVSFWLQGWKFVHSPKQKVCPPLTLGKCSSVFSLAKTSNLGVKCPLHLHTWNRGQLQKCWDVPVSNTGKKASHAAAVLQWKCCCL